MTLVKKAMTQKQTFSIKKYSFGAASVLIAASLWMGAAPVHADEQAAVASVQVQQEVSQSESDSLDTASQAAQMTGQDQEANAANAVTSQEATQEDQASAATQAALETKSEGAAAQVSEAKAEAQASGGQSAAAVQTSTVALPQSPRQSVAVTLAQPQATELVSVTEKATGFELQYNGDIAANERIKFAVWTENNGQNDLVWYDASNKGAAFIDFSKHREYGKYNIHTYSSIAGKMIGRNARTYLLEVPKVTTKFEKTATNTYKVTVAGVPASITDISLPTWSDRNGQDDLKWYKTEKQADGSYTATINTPEVGHYSIHVYGMSRVTGSNIGLTATEGLTNAETGQKANLTVEGYSKNKTNLTVKVDGKNAKAIKSVAIAAWSENKGQDDLKWYSPKLVNNSTSQVIDVKDLSNTSDTYHIHAYTYYADGSVDGRILGDFLIEKESQASAQNFSAMAGQWQDDQGTRMTIKADGSVSFSTGATSKLTVISQKSGGVIEGSIPGVAGYYYVPANVSNPVTHKVLKVDSITVGQGVDAEGKAHPFTRVVEEAKPQPAAKTQVKVNLTADGLAISLDSNQVSDYKQVRFAVWSETKGQDDLKWYNADSQGKIVAPYKNHKDYGKYNVHTYLSTNKGMVGLNATSINVPAPSAKVQVTKVADNTYDVKVSDVPAYINAVQVPVWSENKGQDDIEWIKASKQADGSYIAHVNLAKHKYDTGKYNAHVYGNSLIGNNKNVGLAASSFDVASSKPATSTRLTKEQASDWARQATATIYDRDYNKQFSKDDFLAFVTESKGQFFIEVREDHQSPAMLAAGADPSHDPMAARYRINAKNELEREDIVTGDYVVIESRYQPLFASMAGTWKNGNGETINITEQGQVTYVGTSYQPQVLHQTHVESNGIRTGIASTMDNSPLGYAGFIYVPAGVKHPDTGQTKAVATFAIGQGAARDTDLFIKQ